MKVKLMAYLHALRIAFSSMVEYNIFIPTCVSVYKL